MKTPTNIPLTLMLYLGTTLFSFAQTEGKDSLRRLARQAEVDSVKHAYFAQIGLTNEKLEQLKNIGVDLQSYNYRRSKRDVRVDAVLRTAIIVGKVTDIIDMPGINDKPYHSKINIRIMEVLKGKLSAGDTVQLISQNGPITDGRLPNARVLVPHETEFSIGEISLLFLDNIYKDPYFSTAYKDYLQGNPADLPDPTYHVNPQFRLHVRDSVVKYAGSDIPLNALRTEIKKVLQIIE